MSARAVAVGLAALAAGFGAPVAWVFQGAGAPGRVDSAQLWWERARRLPTPVLLPVDRGSAVRASGPTALRTYPEVRILERRALPTHSPVVAMAQSQDLVAVATFDDGAYVLEPGGHWQRVPGLDAVNALAFGAASTLYAATDDGAFAVEPGGQARRVARGAFFAVAVEGDEVWLASRAGVHRLEGDRLTTWGPDHGVQADLPTSIARCGDAICLGAMNGLWEIRKGRVSHRSTADGTLPAEFVTAVASSAEVTWVGTFDGGLVRLGAPALAMGDGLTEGRIQPRALAVVGTVAVAGTPTGLLVADGRELALLEVGGAVSAVTHAAQGGVWLGMAGQVLRVEIHPERSEVEIHPERSEAESRDPSTDARGEWTPDARGEWTPDARGEWTPDARGEWTALAVEASP